MTGLENLREELRKRGFNSAQANSKIVLAVLGILTEKPELYEELKNAEKEIAECKSTYHGLLNLIGQFKRMSEDEERKLNSLKQEREHLADDIEEYVESFYAAINNAETPEIRDRIRIAQLFTNSVKTEAIADNAAYIMGLASILTGTPITDMTEFKRISKGELAGRFKEKCNSYGKRKATFDGDGWEVL